MAEGSMNQYVCTHCYKPPVLGKNKKRAPACPSCGGEYGLVQYVNATMSGGPHDGKTIEVLPQTDTIRCFNGYGASEVFEGTYTKTGEGVFVWSST